MNERVAAGYFCTRPTARRPWMDAGLVPPRLVSLSDCLGGAAPGTWAHRWAGDDVASRRAGFAAFDLPESAAEALADWVDAAMATGELGWYGAFLTLAKAQEFRSRFLGHLDDAMVVGLGVGREGLEALLAAVAPAAGTAPSGLCTALRRGEALAPGGRSLGFDLLSFDFHSFLCGGAEKALQARLGARPNGLGLYDGEALAQRCAALIDHASLGEPGPWRAWEVVAYE